MDRTAKKLRHLALCLYSISLVSFLEGMKAVTTVEEIFCYLEYPYWTLWHYLGIATLFAALGCTLDAIKLGRDDSEGD